MTTATDWGAMLLTLAMQGPGGSPLDLAASLGEYAFRTGDRDRATAPPVPDGGTVRDPFGDGVDYVRCAHCGTHWPTNATRRSLEWCHGEHERDTVRATVRAEGEAMGAAPDAVKRATVWAGKYYLLSHVRPGCNACQ